MVLAHVAISSPNFRSVLHSVKHASIPTAPHPVGKPDALITTIESNPTLSSDSRPSRSQSRSQSPSQSPSPSPPPSSAPTPEARPKQAHHHHHHHHHRRRRSTRGGATASVGGSIPALAANNNGHSNGSGVNGISTVTSASPSDRESRASSPVPWTTSGSNNTAVTGASANRARSMSNINSTDNNNNNNNNNNKMHQTSSRLLRMTDEDRPFTRDFMDLFATLMVSLPLSPHRVRFQKIEHTFTSEEAINNLGSLKFSQSNRMPDPKDTSRIVTTTTTTTFSMAREMARSVCQRFMDARFIESADGKPAHLFSLKSGLWQLTPKGLHILGRFCQRNGINQKHVIEAVDSPRNAMHLVNLERDATTDKLSMERATIDVVFRRFIGQDGPNAKHTTYSADSDSTSDYQNGIVGVKMARERKIGDRLWRHTFTGKATTDWLMDCSTTIDRKETHEIAAQFVRQGLMFPVVDDKAYVQEHPTSSSAPDFQSTKTALYALTEKGQRIAGWIAREKSSGSDDDPAGAGVGPVRSSTRDSSTNRLSVILTDPALRLLFREFLRETLCEENLSFYLDVVEFTTNYRQAVEKNGTPKLETIRETLAAAYGLYNAFLAPGSPCELNIDHNLRNNLASRMTRAVGDDESMVESLRQVAMLFDEAQNSVYKLMASDSVPKFLKDPKYSNMLRDHDFDSAVPSSKYAPTAPERTMSKLGR